MGRAPRPRILAATLHGRRSLGRRGAGRVLRAPVVAGRSPRHARRRSRGGDGPCRKWGRGLVGHHRGRGACAYVCELAARGRELAQCQFVLSGAPRGRRGGLVPPTGLEVSRGHAPGQRQCGAARAGCARALVLEDAVDQLARLARGPRRGRAQLRHGQAKCPSAIPSDRSVFGQFERRGGRRVGSGWLGWRGDGRRDLAGISRRRRRRRPRG